MSIGNSLQEMENVVNKNAAAAEPMKGIEPSSTPGQASVEDLGGPTPENYKTDDDSSKLKEPGATLSKVRDVATKNAKPAEPMKAVAKEEVEETTEEVVAEVEETVQSVSVDEDIAALLSGEELSEEFQEKAKTIFEAAIASKVAEAVSKIEESYEENSLRNFLHIRKNLLKELILTLSMFPTSGSKKIEFRLSKVSSLK